LRKLVENRSRSRLFLLLVGVCWTQPATAAPNECSDSWHYFNKGAIANARAWAGCTSEYSKKPWCATKTIEVYVSGSKNGTGWANCKANRPGQAPSTAGCVRGPWYYLKGKTIKGPFKGCTTEGSKKPWCATRTISVYMSGGKHGTSWKYCPKVDLRTHLAPPLPAMGAPKCNGWTCSQKYIDSTNRCRGTYYCEHENGTCRVNESNVVECSPKKDSTCEKNACDPKTGKCGATPSHLVRQVEFTVGQSKIKTNERAPQSKALPFAKCDDGNPHTEDDRCSASGHCIPGKFVGQCKNDEDCVPFDDGDLCNGILYCDKAQATCKPNPSSVKSCPTVNDGPCRMNLCIPATGQCTMMSRQQIIEAHQSWAKQADQQGHHQSQKQDLAKDNPFPNFVDLSCHAGQKFYIGDSCNKAGQCVPGKFVGQCKNDADCEPLEDGNLCNGTLYCDKANALCKLNPATVKTCSKTKDTACRRTACAPKTGQCISMPAEDKLALLMQYSPETVLPADEDFSCDDGNGHTVGDQCDGSGNCVSGKFVGQCQSAAACAPYEDGNLCNGTLYCDMASAVCKLNPSTIKVCPSVKDSACMSNTCVPKTGQCSMMSVPQKFALLQKYAPGKLKSGKKSFACNDGDKHTVGDHCDAAGKCISGKFVGQCHDNADCDDGVLCNGKEYCFKETAMCKPNPASTPKCCHKGTCKKDGADK
jgi:hypothetical protein